MKRNTDKTEQAQAAQPKWKQLSLRGILMGAALVGVSSSAIKNHIENRKLENQVSAFRDGHAFVDTMFPGIQLTLDIAGLEASSNATFTQANINNNRVQLVDPSNGKQLDMPLSKDAKLEDIVIKNGNIKEFTIDMDRYVSVDLESNSSTCKIDNVGTGKVLLNGRDWRIEYSLRDKDKEIIKEDMNFLVEYECYKKIVDTREASGPKGAVTKQEVLDAIENIVSTPNIRESIKSDTITFFDLPSQNLSFYKPSSVELGGGHDFMQAHVDAFFDKLNEFKTHRLSELIETMNIQFDQPKDIVSEVTIHAANQNAVKEK